MEQPVPRILLPDYPQLETTKVRRAPIVWAVEIDPKIRMLTGRTRRLKSRELR